MREFEVVKTASEVDPKFGVKMTVHVRSRDGRPRARDVAVRVGYNPDGYGCFRPSVTPLEGEYYRVEWTRSKTCE